MRFRETGRPSSIPVRRSLVAWVVVALLLLPLTSADGGPVVARHTEGFGPLSVMSGSGGFIAAAPVSRPYWISFGSDTPCLETRPDRSADPADPTDELLLSRVRVVDRRSPPAKVQVFLRTVTPRQIRNHPENRSDYQPFIARVGHPLRDLSYGEPVPGRFTRQLAGRRVWRTCANLNRDLGRLSRGDVPRRPIRTLVFAIKTSDERAVVHHSFVDYANNGTPRTLRIDWTMGAQAPRRG